MESDVEEGEIRESECLSPLSDDDNFEPLPPNPKRRRGAFRSPPPPPPSAPYSRRGRRQGTSIWKTGDNKTFKLPQQNEYYNNGYKSQNRRSNRTNSRDGNKRSHEGEGGMRSSRTRTVRRCSKYLYSNGQIPDSPASPDPEIEDINSSPQVAQIRSPSPVELCPQGQRPINANINPISISVSNSAAITNRDEDVEVLSIIDRNDRIAELIVIDSTSSSDSESSETGDENDFVDPPTSPQNPPQNPPPPAAVSPEKEESPKNVTPENVTLTPVTPPQQNIEPPATGSEGFWKPIPIIITRGAPAGDRNAPMLSTPPRVDNEEEEDLEVLELRIKALEGLMNKLPDDREAFERAHAVYVTMDSPTPEEQDLGDDNEKENENELELYLLREKLLSDLAKKKKREEEQRQKQQPSKTKPKTASKTYERRMSSHSHSHNSSSNTNSKSRRHSTSTSRRSSIGRDSSHRRSSRDASSSSTTKKPSRSSSTLDSKTKAGTKSSTSTDKSKPAPTKPRPLPKCPPPPSLSVSVTTDGKHRQVVEGATIVPTPVVPPQEQGQTLATLPTVPPPAPSPAQVPIQQKLVALSQKPPVQKSPVKGKKWKIASPTKLVTNLPGPRPQKLSNSPQLLSKTIQNERFAITRTVINPVAFKSKYRTSKSKKNNYNTTSTMIKKPALPPKKKFVPIVIPLRDNDESTDEEYEGESSSTQKVELAEEFHSSLDKFLKSVREKASKNGVGGNGINPFPSAPNTPSKVLQVENKQAQKISPPAPTNCSVTSPNTLQSQSPQVLPLPSVVTPKSNKVVEEEKVQNASKVKSSASTSPSNLTESDKSISVDSNEKIEIKEAPPNPLNVPVPPLQPVGVKVMRNSNPSLAPLELKPRQPPKKVEQPSSSVGVAASTSPKRLIANSTEKLLKSPTKSPIASPARSDKSIASSSSSTGKQTAESLAEQVSRTRQELELREKLLRATFKKNEMKYKLTTTEKEFLTTRTSATHLLGSAIDKINQHNDKTNQATAMEAQVEKLRKQLELAQRSLFLKKKEAESVHEDAVTAIHRAFDMRATSVTYSLQCKQLGSELNGESYKIPTKGAGDMLQKFKEIYKLTTQSELQKGQINFKKLENEIIAAFSQRQSQQSEVAKLRSSQPPSAVEPPKKKEKSKKGKEKKGAIDAALTRHVHDIILPPANRSPGICSVMLPSRVLMPAFYMPYKSPLICSPPSPFGEIICKFLLRSRCPINNCKLGHFDESQWQASGK